MLSSICRALSLRSDPVNITSHSLRAVYVEALVPRPLWRRLLATYGAEDKVRGVLSVCWSVALANAAVPHAQARPRQPPPYLGPEYLPREAHAVSLQADQVPEDDPAYVVVESVPVEMPVRDPWAKSWD
jgi:hypothetical protein